MFFGLHSYNNPLTNQITFENNMVGLIPILSAASGVNDTNNKCLFEELENTVLILTRVLIELESTD